MLQRPCSGRVRAAMRLGGAWGELLGIPGMSEGRGGPCAPRPPGVGVRPRGRGGALGWCGAARQGQVLRAAAPALMAGGDALGYPAIGRAWPAPGAVRRLAGVAPGGAGRAPRFVAAARSPHSGLPLVGRACRCIGDRGGWSAWLLAPPRSRHGRSWFRSNRTAGSGLGAVVRQGPAPACHPPHESVADVNDTARQGRCASLTGPPVGGP